MKTWMYAALASAALALAAPAANAATVISLDQAGNSQTGFFGKSVTEDPSTSIFTFTTAMAGLASVSVDRSVLSGINFVSAFLNGNPFTFTTLPSGAVAGGSGAVPVLAGQQTITINTTGRGSFGGSVGFQATAVPGPIAGAGLPVLMALGGLVWARRRKATATA